MPTWYQRASWGLFRAVFAKSLLEKMKVSVHGAGELPGAPFILLSDHSNALDAYVLGSLSPVVIHMMANLEGVSPAKAALADLVGAYGRRKGSNDMAALRRTFELAASGEAIGIFPEGDRSWDGSSAPLRPGSAKLLKRLGLPLVLARQRGNYLSMPRWATSHRRGPWSVDYTVYDADEIARLSVGLLEAIIATALEKDEVKEAIREGRTFEAEGSAEGVERLLWQCPVCGKADGPDGGGSALRGEGDEIRCSHCGVRWHVDANQRIEALNIPASYLPEPLGDLKDWSDWQRRNLPVLEADGLWEGRGIRASGARLSIHHGRRLERLGSGVLRLYGGELLFEAPGRGLVFNAAEIHGFIDNFNKFCEFSYRDERWRLELGGGNAAKWCYALATPEPRLIEREIAPGVPA